MNQPDGADGAPTLFFLHIQKTGGTSIRQAAVQHFGVARTLMLYGRRSSWTSPIVLELLYNKDAAGRTDRMAALSEHIERHRIAFVASHQAVPNLPCFDPSRAFTLLRDPVERVLSQFYFFRAQGRTDESLERFIERAEHRNVQARALKRVRPEQLGAVGVQERFAPFVEQVNQRFGLALPVVHKQRGGLVKDIRAGLVGTALRNRIRELNESDEALYRWARDVAP